MLLDDARSILKEAGIETVEQDGALVLMIEDKEGEVVIYLMAEEERGIVYVLASANPPITLEGRALDLLNLSWEIVDRGIPCKVCLNGDAVMVEHDLDECHLTRESLLESIYFAAEAMLYLMSKLTGCVEGHAEV